jgi:hypothetical protein
MLFKRLVRGIGAAAALLCTACVGLVEQGARVVDGSFFAEATLAVYQGAGAEARIARNRDGAVHLLMKLDAFPFLTLRAAYEEGGGLRLAAFQFSAAGFDGWQEFTLDLEGSGVLDLEEGGARVGIAALSAGEISGGEIWHRGARLSGARALENLRGRGERIEALAAWMHGISAPVFTDQKAFEAYWKRLVLPELTPARDRPATWIREGAEWSRAEDIAWNATYTALLFPPELQRLRDSGALLRDWEEAAAWIYFVYQEEAVVREFTKGYVLPRTK